MRRRWFAVSMTLLVCLLVVGCGIPQEDHDAVVAERDAAQAQAASLESDLTEARAEIETFESDLAATQSDLGASQTDLKAAEGDIATLTEERDEAQSDLSAANSQVSSLQSQVSSLQSKYDSANSELTEIKRVYPPQYFSSATELRDWLAGNDISERPDATVAESLIDKALVLQEDALADGYIISVNIQEDPDYFYIAGIALINGYVWAFDIETDEVIQWSTLIQIR